MNDFNPMRNKRNSRKTTSPGAPKCVSGFRYADFSRFLGYLGAWVCKSSPRAWHFRISLGIWVFGYLGIAIAAPAATFEEQRKTVAVSPATQPESAIMSLLEAGLNEGKPVLAIAEAEKWLRQNQPENPMLLYTAGRAAELSGDWKGAVALYQQYLDRADLETETADEAVYAVYTLLIDRLEDTAAAYSFSRNKGDRLMVCPRAKQFNKWFLDQAVRRRDVFAVANRLHACIKAGLSEDLLSARYDNYFRWLLRVVNTSAVRGAITMTEELAAAFDRLTNGMRFSEQLKLRLDWASSVLAYNQARLAGKDVAPPIEKAKALLEKYPKYALWVQTGWTGGNKDIHPNYVGDISKYWPHELDAKIVPVVEAAAKLEPARHKQLLESWQPGYYRRQTQNPPLFQVESVSDYLKSNPKRIYSRMGVVLLEKSWNKLSPKEALALAPKVKNNSSLEASLVRAIAAGITKKEVKDGEETKIQYEKDYDKMMAALLGPEVWRLNSRWLGGRAADQLWHYCGRPGDNEKRDAMIARSKKIAAQVKKPDVKEDAPGAKRLAQFRKLWKDYRSPQPKIPAVYDRLRRVLMFTPEAVPELLNDSSPEAQILARYAIARGTSRPTEEWKALEKTVSVNTDSYDPGSSYLINRHRGMNRIKDRHPEKCKPHPLEDELRKHIAERLKQDELDSWKLIAWINMQWPEDNAEQVKLMEAIRKSPVWNTLSFEARFCAREWFKTHAMTEGQVAWMDAANPEIACKELMALPEDADVETTAAALRKAIAGVKKSPVKIQMRGLEKLAALTDAVFTDEQVLEPLLEIADRLREPCHSVDLARKVLAYLEKVRDPVRIHRLGDFLWSGADHGYQNRPFQAIKKFTLSLQEELPAAAYALAQTARTRLGEHERGGWDFDPREDLPVLKTIAGKTAMDLGLVSIPVPKNHPAYPVYQSQTEWLTGNEKTAWDKLDEHWDQLLPIHRKLSVEYLKWVLQRVIDQRDETRQEPLVKALLAWTKEENTPLTPTEKAEIEIAYGDIAVQRGRLDDAHTLYKRIEENEGYKDLLVQHRATLRKVRVERLAKNYDAALKTLKQLEMERVPEMWAPLRYARAEVFYDMQEYEDANDQIEKILARRPNHAEAKILQGKVQLKREKLMEATEIEVGTVSSQKTLVPGEKLKVTLSDPTLAVSGAGVEVEVAVWTTAGDKERFFLRQFGDQKTKFRGTVETALGKPVIDDGTLQVIGDDEIYYAYSERFRKRLNDIPEQRGGPVTVASDATLMASARKLLSPAEQRLADMERMLEIVGKHRQNIDALDIEERAALKAKAEAANRQRLLQVRVKPGSPIHVRVIDPDRSRTNKIDELAVSVSSSSGDSIGRVVLQETGPYTGWFTGDVPTGRAQAMAFARNSEPGRNPNMVISPVDTYPAWRPEQREGVTPEFTVDLNDNVPLGKMNIVAEEPGAKLKKFVIETGMNHGTMAPVAVLHDRLGEITIEKPWHPSVKIMNDTDHHHRRNDRSVYELREIEHQIERGWMDQHYSQGVAENVAGPADAMNPEIPGKVKWQRRYRRDHAHVIYRFRGYFHEPQAVARRFKVTLGKWDPPKVHPSLAHPAQYMLAVDGRIISEKREKPPKAGAPVSLEGEIDLQPGVHRLEIWSTGWDCRIGFGREVKLLANLENPEEMTACPNSFFDPETFPKGLLPHRNRPATIRANDAGTEFTVDFAPDSRARLIKLVFIDQESPVPALNKLTLTEPDGDQVLPVEQDYSKLNKNDTLEILTGDKVTVRYTDDRFVSKNKKNHERFLKVAYTNAEVEFADIEPRFSNRHQAYESYHERLLRFEYGKPLPLVVHDADMDMSAEADSVKVMIENQSGDKRELIAREMTEKIKIGGTFRAFITPVPKTKTTIKKNEIPVAEGGTLTMIYRDAENTSPGVPTERYARIRHAEYQKPTLKMAHASVSRFEPEPGENWPTRGLIRGFTPIRVRRKQQTQAREGDEEGIVPFAAGRVRPRWQVDNKLLTVDNPPAGGFQAVHGRYLHLELVAPYLALRERSKVKIYLQTEAGRKLARQQNSGEPGGQARQPNQEFDVSVPGTVVLNGSLGSHRFGSARPDETPQIATYVTDHDWNRGDDDQNRRFKVSVPLVADVLPEYGGITPGQQSRRRKRGTLQPVHGLVVQPGDRVHIGFKYQNDDGEEKWLTASANVITHPVLDVMNETYRTPKETAYVGENLYLRVVDLGADQTDKNDTLKVRMKAASGAEYDVALSETDPHSGIFRGVYVLTYAKGEQRGKDYNVKMEGFPVTYGDKVEVSYTDDNGVQTETHSVEISQGADGTIAAFTKKYEDRDIAMRTQFALAEGYLEVAKHHRKLGETKAAALEYARAKQLLSKAMNEFRDPETRAHAEYLLGNLTLEEADATEKKDLREQRYRAALSRFMDVTGTYSETLHAAKAQFKIATVYEKLDEPDIAAREYVKLAYKYPESENLAVAMARLGAHFQRQAAGYEKKAKPLLAKTEDKDAQYDGKALQTMASQHYVKAANIFSRLQERFPSHELAGKGGLLAGQAFMRAGEMKEAVDAFLRVVNEENYDGVKVRSPAMYWAGRCYQKLGQTMPAYSMYKRLTYDFPESKWAAYARGQLSQKRMLKLETKLEIERLKEGR